MATLLLSTYFHLIIEVKNWQGTVIFGPNGQVTQMNLEGLQKGYKNPIPQVLTQVHRLKLWMKKNRFPDVPVLYPVVFSFPSTIIQAATPQITVPPEVIHNSDVLFKIQNMEERYKSEVLSKSRLHKMALTLKSQHVPQTLDVFQKFHIHYNELIKGEFCPVCHRAPMERNKRKWHPKWCGCYSTDAHYTALNDYILLDGE